MVEHYFTKEPKSKLKMYKLKARVRGNEIEFYSGTGLFSLKRLDKASSLLIEHATLKKKWKVLDLGCGYGIIGIALKLSEPSLEVTFSDINARAIQLSQHNLDFQKMKGTVVQSDGFANITGEFNTILLNPPQTAGKKICLKMIEDSKKHLKKKGLFQMVARHNKGGKDLSKKMEEVYGNCKDIVKKAGVRVYISEKE